MYLCKKVPSGSTSRASFKPSELAKSTLAAVTARIIAFGRTMYFKIISLICRSMSLGWPGMGTLVIPGKSTNVKLSTCGLKMRKLMGSGEMFLVPPVLASVSATISSLIFAKSVNLAPGLCKNSPHSSGSLLWLWWSSVTLDLPKNSRVFYKA